jgi:hypothetical protein
MFRPRMQNNIIGLLLAALLVATASGTAMAEPGPFWHLRANSKEGEGKKVEATAPVAFSEEGGEQDLQGTIAGSKVDLSATNTQVKGQIFNSTTQGQIKVELAYGQVKLDEPSLKGCGVIVGEKNIVQAKGHLMWKWNGETKQLEEASQASQAPVVVFTAEEPALGMSELNQGNFTTITFKGSGCGVLTGTFALAGSVVGVPTMQKVQEWSSSPGLQLLSEAKVQQHFWDGKGFQGTKAGLVFSGSSATLTGGSVVEGGGGEEVAIFEK